MFIMDYVYICRNGDNEELRYSLRSLQKNMPYGNVWIIGHRPTWYRGNFIKVDDSATKFDNIKKCISLIPEVNEISENFILMNDDFFVLNKIDKIKILHGGLLEDKIKKYKELRMSSKYIRLLETTFKDLIKNGIKNPIDYDIHTPLPMTKTGLKETFGLAYFPRSAYGNIKQIGGDMISDVKIYSRENIFKLDKNNTPDFISTEDQSFNKIRPMLEIIFPEPSSFEIKTNWNL